MKMKKLHITVSEKMINDLKMAKAEIGSPVTEIIRRSITEFLERREEVKRKENKTVKVD